MKELWLVTNMNKLINGGLVEIVVSSIKENEDYIIELNKRQLIIGKRSDGIDLGEYSPRSLAIKAYNGRPSISGNKISLHDTGDFWKGFFVNVDNDFIEVLSKDSKANMLIYDWTDKIFGLSDESIRLFQDRVAPIIQDKIMKFILGT